MSTEGCFLSKSSTFLIRKLPLIVMFTTLSFQCICESKECKDIAGPFKFRSEIVKFPYLIVHEGDHVTIDCSTTVCNATVFLLVDGKRISQSKLFNETLKRDGDVFSFTAHGGHDAAFLQCQATRRSDVINSISIELTIKPGRFFEPVTVIPNVTEVTLEKGDHLEVICQASGYGTRDLSYINWYQVNATGKHLLQEPLIERRSTPGLDKEMLTIQNADFGIQGTYICERQVPSGPVTAAKFQLTFKEPKIPLVSVSPSSLRCKEASGAINVTCVAIGGSPRPFIEWYKNGFQLKACHKDLRSCPLIIAGPKYPDDDGNFTCIATNSEGSNSSTVNVQVVAPPIIANAAPSNQDFGTVVDVDQIAELTCNIKRANPLPNIAWFRLVGNQWSKEFEKVRVVPNISTPTSTSTLVVPPSKSNALFRCLASNEAGHDSKNITVHWNGGAFESMGVQREVLAIVVSLSIILILLVLLVAYGYKRRLLKRYGPYLQTNLHFEFNSDLLLQEQSHKMPYDPKWEFPRDKVFLLEPIGKGAFGEVWLAKAQGILEFRAKAMSMSPIKKKRFSRMFSFISDYSNMETVKDAELSKVAVKTLKADATQSEYKDLASELKILIHIGEHQNIVNLLGACSRSGKLCVILEYCPYGDLSSFLRSKRDIFQPSWQRAEDEFNSDCTYFDLANFTYQIARGMDFLASKKCVHRDLAARNILVSKDHNDAFVVKIADFGMSRDIYKDEVYVKQSSGVLPLKWTAPESIADAIYTSQSDVWSYGIVLWEIFTLGGSPYPGVSTDEFLGFLKSNRKMEQPDSCPGEFYSLMVDCWKEEPDMRPVFSQIYERIGNIIEEFADINATYLRLESVPSPESKKQATSEYVNSESCAERDAENRDTIKIAIDSYDGSTGSDEEEGYENISSLKKLIEDGSRSEYVDMVNNDQNDENDNVFQSQRTHILL